MYKQHFGFTELPFSIVPNSRFLFQSQRHKEALFRLQVGLGEGGGFAMLSGEVGTGKTTVARALLKSLGTDTQPGLILNPTFSSIELLEAICDEFSIEYQSGATLKQLNQKIHEFLLSTYANGIQTLLVIDEAQHLSAEVLEQLRLLTNLETDNQKLLKVLLVGQPELQQKLQMPQLRQLAQRITGDTTCCHWIAKKPPVIFSIVLNWRVAKRVCFLLSRSSILLSSRWVFHA